jgi:multiple sugar transport system substrate-binding protein
MIWGAPEYIDAGKALVAQFNQEHPDITVTYRSIPWANWYQTFVTAIGSGTAPDLSTGAGYGNRPGGSGRLCNVALPRTRFGRG